MFGGSYPTFTKGQHSLISLWKSHPLFYTQGTLIRKKSWAVQPSLCFHSETELSGSSLLLKGFSPHHLTWTHLEASREPSEKLPNTIYLRQWEIWPILWKLTLLYTMIIFEINNTWSLSIEIFADSSKLLSVIFTISGLIRMLFSSSTITKTFTVCLR